MHITESEHPTYKILVDYGPPTIPNMHTYFEIVAWCKESFGDPHQMDSLTNDPMKSWAVDSPRYTRWFKIYLKSQRELTLFLMRWGGDDI